jgi:hypothetical protein
MIIESAGFDEQQVAKWIAEDAVARRYTAFFRLFGVDAGARTG